MFQIRKSDERGKGEHGWLRSRHTFSFANYYDPAQMGFRSLRVMNEDWIAPGEGFGMHGHRDMEIVTCVLAGELQHKDNLGNGEILRPGELQQMSAGTGVRHSEFNPSASETVHLYQIWLLPEREGLAPSYSQRRFDPAEQDGRFRVVASRDGREGSLVIHQDAAIYLARLAADQSLEFPLATGRDAWLQVLRGSVQLNGLSLSEGDGVAISQEPRLLLQAAPAAELMLFDLAAN